MRSRLPIILAASAALAFLFASTAVFAGRGGGGRAGGGGGRVGGGSLSRPSGGGGGSISRPSGGVGGANISRPSGGGAANISRPAGGASISRPSGVANSRPAQLPSVGASRPSGGRVPSAPATRPSGGDRPLGKDRPSSGAGIASQLPSGNRPGGVDRPAQQPSRPVTRPGGSIADRPSQLPAKPGGADRPARPGGDVANRPGVKPGQRPSKGDVGNFLGIASGVAGGAAIASQLPARGERPDFGERPGIGQRPERPNLRPEERPDWSERSQGRNDQWNQRVDNRNDAWNQRADNRQKARNDFQQNRDERWNKLETGREDRQNWRDQNRGDWQEHRKDLWEYRGNRAEEIWDKARDWHDDVFDDRWWGAVGWGGAYAGIGHYPVNPWWWWRPVGWAAVASFVDAITPDPVYIDHGMTVIYEGDTVYVDGQPMPAAQYTQPIIELAANVDQPPPPMPPPAPAKDSKGAKDAEPAAEPVAEWLPLGVFALAQEEKGEPIMFFQLSVNRAGVITGAYQSTLTEDQRPVAGQVDKASQRAAWRIGENKETIFTTSLANLTQDVCTVAIHFGETRTQTWLLVRMPEPAPAGQEQKLPEAPKSPPPLTKQSNAK